jgi:hypothetical protein
VKCDEGKPCCNRCLKARRTCEGYTILTPKDPNPLEITLKLPQFWTPTPTYSLPLITSITPQEAKALYFFTQFTASGLSGYLTSSFWTHRVIQASVSEPSIRHGIIAIGALHRHFSLGQFAQPTLSNPSSYIFARRQNTLAIGHLHQMMAAGTQQLDITLISCILFTIFDGFLGNYQEAMIHLRSGLDILNEMKNITGSKRAIAAEWFNEFYPILMRIGVQFMIFLDPQNDEDRTVLWLELKSVVPCQNIESFQSLDEAQYQLFALGAEILYDRNANSETPWCPQPGPLVREFLDRKHLSALACWEKALKDYLATLDTSGDSMDESLRVSCLLKIYHIMMKIVVKFPQKPDDSIFQEILLLCGIIDGARITYTTDPQIIDFSSELGIIAPLFFTVVKCQNPKIRLQALNMLSRAPRREGMWDAGVCALVAGKALAATSSLDADFSDPNVSAENCALHQEVQLRVRLS